MEMDAVKTAYIERHAERTKHAIAEFNITRVSELAKEQSKNFLRGQIDGIKAIVVAFPSSDEMDVFAQLVIDVVRAERVYMRGELYALLADCGDRKKVDVIYEMILDGPLADLKGAAL